MHLLCTLRRDSPRTARLASRSTIAIESVRVNMFSTNRDKERAKISENGFRITPAMETTPKKMIEDSTYCNTPAHRRKKAKDGAVM